MKILPVIKYPFSNVQNQIINEDLSMIDFVKLDNPDSAIFTSEDVYFNNAPDLKTGLENDINTSISISMLSFNLIYVNELKVKYPLLKMQDFTMLVVLHNEEKYYYFIEGITRINGSVYTLNVSLDVMKTYHSKIMNLQNVKPLRHFPKVSEFFNFDSLSDSELSDPIINYPTDPTIKYVMKHLDAVRVAGVTTGYRHSGVWVYFYIASSEESRTSFQGVEFDHSGYYIVAYPKYPQQIGLMKDSFNIETLRSLYVNPSLLKVVESDIPPFVNLPVDSYFTTFYHYEVVTNTGADESAKCQSSFIGTDATFPYKDVYNPHSTYLKICNTKLSIPQTIRVSVSNDTPLLFVTANQPSSRIRREKLYPLADNQVVLSLGSTPDFIPDNYPLILDVETSKTILKTGEMNINDGETNLHHALLTENIECGYNLDLKMPLRRSLFQKLSDGRLALFIVSFIEHSLAETVEKIMIRDNKDEELFMKRKSPLQGTQITSEYSNYILQNMNVMKQNQVNYDIAERDAKINGAFSFVNSGLSAVGNVLSGNWGGVASNVVGVAQNSYNLISNVEKIQQQRNMVEAQLSDMKLKPLNIKAGSFCFSQHRNLFYPIITIYRRRIKTALNTNFISSEVSHEQIIKHAQFGYFTPNSRYMLLSQAFNRTKYNFIQLQDVDKMIMYEGKFIPNNHYRLILAVLENGVTYNTPSVIENGGIIATNEFQNTERTTP